MSIETSVIIPVYNCANYLRRCVDSVLNQSYKNYELILVDDGSTDESGEMCDQYAHDNEHVIVIHQKNQGVSVARNTAIEKSSGKYIVFIDGDDFVAEDLLYRLNQIDADLVMVGSYDYSNNKIMNVFVEDEEIWSVKSEKGIEKFLNNNSSSVVWGKRYRKAIIDQNNIRFRKELSFCEDRIFNNDYILKSDTVFNISWAGYYYCQYDSTTLSSVAEQTSFIKRTQWRKIAIEQFRDYPDVQNIYISQMLYFAEKEIEHLCKEKGKFKQNYGAVSEIISDDFFRFCMENMPDTFPYDVKLFCKYRLVLLLMLKYRWHF